MKVLQETNYVVTPFVVTPFVVQSSDVDLFDSLDNLDDIFLPTSKGKNKNESQNKDCCCPEDSISSVPPEADDFSIASSTFLRRNRRSSVCSTASSNSSICSKTFNSCVSVSNSNSNSHAPPMTVVGGEDEECSIASCLSSTRNNNNNNSSRRSSRSTHHNHKKKKKNRRVSFHARLKIRSIPSVEDLSQEDLNMTWYRDYELKDIKARASTLLKQQKQGLLQIEDPSELRGLKSTLNPSNKKHPKRRAHWIMALTCVLDEQQRQHREHCSDPETLAKLYKSFAFSSQQQALILGQEDALAAAREY